MITAQGPFVVPEIEPGLAASMASAIISVLSQQFPKIFEYRDELSCNVTKYPTYNFMFDVDT